MKALRNSYTLTCLLALVLVGAESQAQRMSIGQATGKLNDVVDLPLTITADEPVQGFVMSFEWDARKLEAVDLLERNDAGEPLEDAEMIIKSVEPDHMLFSVVMDTDGMGMEVLPPGENIVADARLRCICDTVDPVNVVIAFIDGKYAFVEGGPVQSNTVVIGGRSIRQEDGLELVNGLFVCGGDGGGGPDPEITCGGEMGAGGVIPPAVGGPGDTVPVRFYYRMAPNGLGDESDQIEGLSVSVSYDCLLTCVEDSFSIEGSALEAADTEFIDWHCDNDPDDGDRCELIVGALIDAAPPFDVDGRKLPPTADFDLLFRLDFTISTAADADACLDVSFVDNLNGRGTVPTKNLASINFFEQPLVGTNCEVCVEADVEFLRGDCNFNETVNVADAAAAVGFLFRNEAFSPPCLDACDSNDSGDLDLTDIVFLLQYLFRPGSPVPPPPGATPPAGVDPTADDLTCLGR